MEEKNLEIEKLEIKNEKLEKEVERLKKQTGRFESLILSRDSWKECAIYYAEKFQLAYKGYLLTQNVPLERAERESLSVLQKIQSLE
jgi:hypothetical protein